MMPLLGVQHLPRRRAKIIDLPSLAPRFQFVTRHTFINTNYRTNMNARNGKGLAFAFFQHPNFITANFLHFAAHHRFNVTCLWLGTSIQGVSDSRIAVFGRTGTTTTYHFQQSITSKGAENTTKRTSVNSRHANFTRPR